MKYYHWGKWQIEKTSVHHRDFNYPRRLREINLGERLILVLMDVHHVQYLIKKKREEKMGGALGEKVAQDNSCVSWWGVN